MRDTILEILEDIGEDVDLDTCETLIDDGTVSYTHLDVYKRQTGSV